MENTVTDEKITDLIAIVGRTLSQAGMDRMTDPQIEEVLACSALTAHF